MDPLNLLKELYGEDPVRKILSSGFDSLSKIAAATPESLSFFSGIQESLARQIIHSAEEGMGNRGGKGTLRETDAGTTAPPTLPRELSRPAPARKGESERAAAARVVEPLDARPLLDAGGIVKSLAREPHPKEFLNDDELVEEVGLSHAEAGFLQGISPSSGSPLHERFSPVPFEVRPGPRPATSRPEELEFAPISDWSPEKEPDPVPKIVRAPELGPDLSRGADVEPPTIEVSLPVEASPLKASAPSLEGSTVRNAQKASFWRFGR